MATAVTLDVMNHYDHDTDIVWLLLEGRDADHVRVEDYPWGLIERDCFSGQVVGIEMWNASNHLPTELLNALPQPNADRTIVVERPDLARRQPA